MVFSSNPLALSVPEPAFESWLRDTGYLEILDQRTSAAAAAATATSNSNSAPIPATGLFSRLLTLLSLFTLNPFAKLTSDDFSGDTPSWSRSFVGSLGSYSFPSSPSQARFRVHENVKRYARNYAYLFILFFASAFDRWGLDQYPVIRQCLLRIAQCATAVILIFSNVQMALFCAVSVSYAGVILHAAFRKLTPAKQPSQARGR